MIKAAPMRGDQASGLRQWSQRSDAVSTSPTLVVMALVLDDDGADRLAQRLALPEGAQRWQPQPLVLSQAQTGAVPDSPWWVLQLPALPTQSASVVAGALRALHRGGMPSTILLAAPDHLAVAGLVNALYMHLGVTLLQDVTAWQQAAMARAQPG